MQQPTMTVDKHDNKIWRLNGKHHREDGPAIEGKNGDKAWCLHGELHREDGSAVEYTDGNKAWYLHGNWYENAFEWAIALLKLKGNKKPSENDINDVVQQATSASILD